MAFWRWSVCSESLWISYQPQTYVLKIEFDFIDGCRDGAIRGGTIQYDLSEAFARSYEWSQFSDLMRLMHRLDNGLM